MWGLVERLCIHSSNELIYAHLIEQGNFLLLASSGSVEVFFTVELYAAAAVWSKFTMKLVAMNK